MEDRHFNRTLLIVVLPLVCVGAGSVAALAGGPSGDPRMLAAPASPTTDDEAYFRFRAKGARTSCQHDGMRFRPCEGSVKYTGLGPGRHSFAVRVTRNGRVQYLRHSWTQRRRAGAGSAHKVSRRPERRPTLVFSEDFDGPALDASSWNVYESRGTGGYGYRRASAVSVDGRGHLVIRATMDGGKVISGGLAHRIDYKYGRFVFRVRTEPDPSGAMSGVVLTWPKVQSFPQFTENDIYETGAGKPSQRDRITSFIHFGSQNWQKFFTHDSDPTKWHKMEMDWTPDQLNIYRDGALAWSITDRAVIPDVLHHLAIQFDALTRAKLKRPVRMFVDYVRIYSYEPAG